MNKRINWYRIPIDKDKLKLLSQRSDRKGYYQSITHIGLWTITGLLSFYFFKKEFWEGFIITLSLHGLVGSHFSHAHHELCHGTVFKTKYLNTLFLNIFSLLGFLNYHIYKMSHTYHHRNTCFSEGDREVVLPRKPDLGIFYLIQLFTINIFGKNGILQTLNNFIKISLNNFDNPFNSWSEELYIDNLEQRVNAKIWARTVLLFHLFVIIFSFSIGEPIISVLISFHVFIGGWHYYFLNETQHTGLQSNIADFRKCTRSIRINPISEFLYWHMNWHIEHHMYTSIPCYNLKLLHHVISYDMPEPRSLWDAWVEMRKTWKKQKTEHNYEFDTPVPKNIIIKNKNILTYKDIPSDDLAPI